MEEKKENITPDQFDKIILSILVVSGICFSIKKDDHIDQIKNINELIRDIMLEYGKQNPCTFFFFFYKNIQLLIKKDILLIINNLDGLANGFMQQ